MVLNSVVHVFPKHTAAKYTTRGRFLFQIVHCTNPQLFDSFIFWSEIERTSQHVDQLVRERHPEVGHVETRNQTFNCRLNLCTSVSLTFCSSRYPPNLHGDVARAC